MSFGVEEGHRWNRRGHGLLEQKTARGRCMHISGRRGDGLLLLGALLLHYCILARIPRVTKGWCLVFIIQHQSCCSFFTPAFPSMWHDGSRHKRWRCWSHMHKLRILPDAQLAYVSLCVYITSELLRSRNQGSTDCGTGCQGDTAIHVNSSAGGVLRSLCEALWCNTLILV